MPFQFLQYQLLIPNKQSRQNATVLILIPIKDFMKEEKAMKDEKKVKVPEEEAKKEVKAEENGVELTDEEMAQVNAGLEPSESHSRNPAHQ